MSWCFRERARERKLLLLCVIVILTYLYNYSWTVYNKRLFFRLDSQRADIQITKRPTVYVITPTYNRSSQRPDMTMLCQTLMHVPDLHWIVAEDSPVKSPWLSELLKRSGMMYTHLNVTIHRAKKKLKGMDARNTALEWLTENASNGTLCFSDDDNSYDIQYFEEVRKVKTIGLQPTGHFSKTGISTPVVINGTIVDFIDFWIGGRKFPVDMCSVALNLEYYLDKGAPLFKVNAASGHMETKFLESLVKSKEDIQPLAENCTKIYAWHTKTYQVKNVKRQSISCRKCRNTNHTSNLPELLKSIYIDK